MREPATSALRGRGVDTLRYVYELATPNDLARELGETPLAVRTYVRSKYGRLAERQETRWRLDPEQVADVRREFQRRAGV